MAAAGDLRSLLGAAQFNTLSRDMQSLLQQLWSTHTENLKADLEKTRVDGEQKVLELQKKTQTLEAKLATFTEENEKGESALSQYREQATTSSALAARLSEEVSKLTADRDDLKRQICVSRLERDDMWSLAEGRQTEINRLHARLREINEEINRATAARCEAEGKAEEIESREMQLAFKEERFADEKQFLESQIRRLQEEVEKRNEEVLMAKRDAGYKMVELTQELAEKSEQLIIARKQEEILAEEVQEFRSKAEKLAEKLKAARSQQEKLEDNYRAELRAQTKLTELYQQHGQENTAKTEELGQAVSQLQQLLKESAERYGKLEAQMEELKAKHREELDAKGETVKALRMELEEANKLLKTFKDKGLTEDGIECLSPSAAQASRLLKSGITLTGIYSQMVAISEELAQEKEENRRLNSYMDQILLEIEERAPILRQQRENYENAMATVGGLTESLERAREEVELRRSEADEARRKLNTLERDRDRLDQQVADLGKQVVVLVREVEAARGGLPSESVRTPMDTSSAEAVVEARLLSFRDITELQQRNIELLAVVRELSANREQTETTLLEEKTAEVRHELDTALRQVEELRSARQRQQLMVENIIQQRDLYKSMCAAAQKETPAGATPSAFGAKTRTPEKSGDSGSSNRDQRTQELEKQLEELREEFADYKKEKSENCNMLDKELARMREELFEAKSQAAKLASHEEYNNERFSILQTNCQGYKRQIEALEMRNKQVDVIAAKHEVSITALREELAKAYDQASAAEFQVNSLNQQVAHLKAVEARLVAEREVLYKERNSTSKILANLQQIQLNLERKDEEETIRLKSENAALGKEVALLRKKVDEEQHHFKESVRNWENTNRELRETAVRCQNSEQAAIEQLTMMSTTLETMKEELKNKEEELQLAESRLAGRGQLASQSSLTSDTEAGKSRKRDVELLLAQTKQELKSVNSQLNEQKRRVEEFKMISETAEKRMLESSKAMADYKTEADTKVKSLEDEKIAAEKKAAEAASQLAELRQRVEDLESEAGVSSGELREKLRSATTELEAARERIAQLEAQEVDTRAQMASLGQEAKEAQDKYERELLQHAQNIEKLNKLKAEANNRSVHFDELAAERARAEARSKELEEMSAREAEARLAELTAVREELDLTTKENSALMNQLERVSQQLADVSASGRVLDTSQAGGQLDASLVSNTSFRSLNEDEANNEQLMSIIKYLRREKEIVAGRLEVAESAIIRTNQQLEQAEKAAADAIQALELERQNQNQTVMSAGKHVDLMRKVESLAALTDSNRLLREEKQKLEAVVGNANHEAEKARAALASMEAKMRDMEDRLASIGVEKAALASEAENWKKRSDQLIEKSFKLNPDELRRLQEQNQRLTATATAFKKEKVALAEKVSLLTKELGEAKQAAATTEQEAKKVQADLQEKVKENKNLIAAQTTNKNAQNNLNKQNTDLKKKVEELEKAKKEGAAALAKIRQEMSELQTKAAEGSKTGGEELTQLRQELEKVKKEAQETKTSTSKKIIDMMAKNKALRDLGIKLRQQKTVLEKEKEALEEEIKNAKAATPAVDDEAPKLIEETCKELEAIQLKYEETKKREEELTKKENRAKEVLKSAKDKIDRIMAENAELREQLERKEGAGSSGDMDSMRSAALISQVKKMQEEKATLERLIAEEKTENERLRQEMEAAAAAASAATQTTAVSTQAPPKPVAIGVAGVVQQQQQQASQPQQQQVPAVVAAGQRKQVQAAVPPHRHQPPSSRDGDRPPTQMASIRPLTQQQPLVRTSVVLPTSQAVGSSGGQQPEVATVQPTMALSVSGGGGPQLPSTSQQQQPAAAPSLQLDPLATEFIPADRSSSSAAVMMGEVPIDTSESDQQQQQHSRSNVVGLRSSGSSSSSNSDQPQASTSGPAALYLSHAAQTSTTSGGGGGPTASVLPNLKRPREAAPDSDSQLSTDEQAAGPSSVQQKRARTVSSTADEFGGGEGSTYDQVSSGTADPLLPLPGVSGSQDMESDSSAALESAVSDAELREVGSSSQIEMAGSSGVVVRTYTTAAAVVSSDTAAGVVGCSGQEDEEEEELLDIEQGMDEEEGEDMEEGEISEEADVDELNDDQEDLGPSAEPELGEEEIVARAEGEEEGLEATSDAEQQHEEEDEEEERDNQPAPEDANEDNSSEPSSSTGTSQQQHHQPSQQHQALGIETDVGQEDGVVPSTPKLAEPRRPDGFAEAVSSPQAPSNDRFLFGLPSGLAATASGSGGPDTGVVTSSNSSLMGQEGAEITAYDISQFAAAASGSDGDAQARPDLDTPGTTSSSTERPPEVSGEISHEPEAASPYPFGGSDSSEPTAAATREMEEGVSSSGAADPQQQQTARPSRTPIVWTGSPTQPASTSPQRHVARSLVRTALRGVTSGMADTAARGRGRGAKRGS